MTRLLFPTLLIIAAIALFFYYTKPVQGEITAIKEQRTRFEEVLVKARELDQMRARLIAEYESIPPEDLERLSKMLPEAVDNVRLIIETDTIAGRYDMQVRDVSFEKEFTPRSSGARGGGGESIPEQELQSMIFRFNVSGSYDDFLNFVADLEQNLRLVDMTSLSFESTLGEPYDYSVAIKTYWIPRL